MTDTDLLIQNLRRESEALRAGLEWKQKEIELARRSPGASMRKCANAVAIGHTVTANAQAVLKAR